MSLPNANAIARQAKIRAELEASNPSATSSSSAYLQEAPDSQVLSDPRALADIRDYYRKWKGQYFSDDKEMLEAFHEDQSWNNLNTVGAGINWAEASSVNEEQRAHMSRMTSLYHKVPMLNSKGGFADHIGGFNVAANIGQSILADPLNLIGFGAGGAVGKVAARGAVAVGESGMRAGVKAAAKRGALVEGAVAAPVGMGIDALTQGYEGEVGLQDEYSLSRGLMAGGIGLAAGAGLGGIMAAFSGAWGARIGTKQAQRLLDEGYTPESIPMMTQKEVDFALTPEGAAAKLDTETQESYDQRAEMDATESAQLDEMDAQRAAMDAADRKVPVEEAISWVDKDDYDVLTGAIDRVQARLDQTTNPVGRKPLVAQINLLNRNRVKLRNGAARQAEIDEELKTASGKAQETLFKESEELSDLKETVAQIRNSLEASQNAPELAPTTRVPTNASDAPAPTAPEVEPEVAPAPVAKTIEEGEADTSVLDDVAEAAEYTAPEAAPVVDDVVEAAVPEAAPVSNGRPRADLTLASISLLQELGVDQKVIERAVKSKRPDQRKKLMKQIVEAKGLAVEGEDVASISINDLAARIKTYTDEQVTTATETTPVQRPVETAESPDYTTAQMDSDIPNSDDARVLADIMNILDEPAPKAKEATPEAAPEAAPISEVPEATPRVADPAPIPFEEISRTTLNDLGLTSEDNAILLEVLKSTGKSTSRTSSYTVGSMTIDKFDMISTDLTTAQWGRYSTSLKKRIDALKTVEEIRQKLMPNGIIKNTQSRKLAVAEIRKKFKSHGTVFVDNAVALFDRFGDLGYADTAPIFGKAKKGNEGTWEPNAKRNRVNISDGEGLTTPKLAIFYHEMAHWMYGNILTPGQKIEFMESMGKYYKEDGSLDQEKLTNALPYGNKSRVSKEELGQYSSSDGTVIGTNSDLSPQEFFAESFSMFSMRSHASPDAQLETFFQKVQIHFKYLYERFIKQSGVVDPDLERLFINIIPNEKQHRDLLTENVTKVALLNAEPKTPTGQAIRIRIATANDHNMGIEEALGNTSIIEKMKELGKEFYSLSSQRGKTGAFRQTTAINPELRKASEGIYASIREFYGEANEKMGGDLDWEAIESGFQELPRDAEIELSEILSAKWEKGGIRELVSKLDDTLRAQYFRHEQELILSGMSKESFPEALDKYRDGFKIKVEWQKKKPEIMNPTLVEWATKAKSKNVPKTPRDQLNSDKFALKKLSIEELTRMATGVDDEAQKAAIVLLEKWKSTSAKIPKGFKAKNSAIDKGTIAEIQVILREALIDSAAGDARASSVIKEARLEMANRGQKRNQKKANRSNLNNVVRILVAKEERLFNGPIDPDEGIPENISAVGKEFLTMFTHRSPDVQTGLRTVMARFLNMLDMDANSEFLGTKFLDNYTLMGDLQKHWGKIGDPNTPYAKDMVNELDLSSPESKKFLADGRRNVVSLSGTNAEMVRDGIRGMARLALRTQAIPSSSKIAILDTYRLQPESVKKKVVGQVGGAATEHQQMEYFFTEAFIHYLSGKFPEKDNIFTGLDSREADKIIDIFDDVRDSVKYLTDGIVDKSKLVGIFDELAHSEPLGANQIKIQRSDATADTMLRGVFPAMKDEMVSSYLMYLAKTSPTRLELLNNAASGYGRKANGDIQIFWHSSPNGGALDRSNNPILRQSRDGQHGRGTYMTTSADVGYDSFALRPTYQAKKAMVDKLAVEQDIDEGSLTYQRVMKDLEDLHKAQQDSSTSASYMMKAQENVGVLEARISKLITERADDSLLEQAELDLDKQLDVIQIMNDNFVELDMNISVLHKNLKSSVGYKPDPVMIPLILKADRMAMFDATMHRPDSDLISQMLGRIKQIESKVVDPSETQQTILNGAEGGIAERIAERVSNNLNEDHSLTGQDLYSTMVSVLSESFPDDESGVPLARAFIDDVIESLGYEGKVGSTRNTLRSVGKDGELLGSETKFYKEVVIFDSRKTNHLASDLFDEESSMLYSKVEVLSEAQNPNTAVLLAAVNSEGNINHRGWAGVVGKMEDEGAPPSLTNALVAVAKRKTLSEGQANALKQYGPKQFFSKGSDRLRSNGMKWLGDFIQPLHGTGFHERQNSELARRIVPIIQKIGKLPDAKGVIGAWASKNNPLRTTQAPSVTRIVKTLRRTAGHESEKRLSPEEFSVYQDLRVLFSQEAASLKESGVIMGNIEDYFPQVWNKEAMIRDKDGVISDLARHLMRESITERNSDITPAIAIEKAKLIFNRLTDDDGVFMPPPTSGRRDSTGDHIDYQRMIRLDKYPDSLKSLEKYLENDLEGMMTKYFDMSTRRVAMANKFGANSHGYYDYMYTVEHGIRGAVELITKGKVFSREIIIPEANG